MRPWRKSKSEDDQTHVKARYWAYNAKASGEKMIFLHHQPLHFQNNSQKRPSGWFRAWCLLAHWGKFLQSTATKLPPTFSGKIDRILADLESGLLMQNPLLVLFCGTSSCLFHLKTWTGLLEERGQPQVCSNFDAPALVSTPC